MTLPLLIAALTLFEQSAAKRVQALPAEPGFSYLVISAQSGHLIATNWADRDKPIPVGSLVKPFTALAFLQNGPNFFAGCGPRQCWLPTGHGRIGMVEAIAYSCNAYFQQMATHLSSDGVPAAAKVLTGFGRDWPQAPEALAEAYRVLPNEAKARPVVAGMRMAARKGTAKGLHAEGVLAKTGTAPCSHGRGQGDGFVVAISPNFVVLVRVHGTTGAKAAERSRQLMAALRP